MALGCDTTCGGIWWNKAHAKKNAIANELFLKVAVRLYLHAQQSGDSNAARYRESAERTWTWFQ